MHISIFYYATCPVLEKKEKNNSWRQKGGGSELRCWLPGNRKLSEHPGTSDCGQGDKWGLLGKHVDGELIRQPSGRNPHKREGFIFICTVTAFQ